MDNLLDSIRVAVAPGASDATKATGAAACRTILTALEAKAGEPLVPVLLTSDNVPATPETMPTLVDADGTALQSEAPAASIKSQALASNVAAAVTMLRQLPPEQLLDLAIARLRAALPAGVEVAPVKPLRFQILQVPQLGPKR